MLLPTSAIPLPYSPPSESVRLLKVHLGIQYPGPRLFSSFIYLFTHPRARGSLKSEPCPTIASGWTKGSHLPRGAEIYPAPGQTEAGKHTLFSMQWAITANVPSFLQGYLSYLKPPQFWQFTLCNWMPQLKRTLSLQFSSLQHNDRCCLFLRQRMANHQLLVCHKK